MNNHYKNIFLAIVAMTWMWVAPAQAREINVRGIVTNSSGEPLQGVCIYDVDNDRLLGMTNEEGKYLVIVDSEGKLSFSLLGKEDTEENVMGRLTIDVTLTHSSIVLDGVTVKSKSKLKIVSTEKTDIEVKGNYLHLKNNITVPGKLFDSSTRLVIQPALYDVTASRMWYLKPIVYDGRRYHITQERMHDFHADEDPLNPYVTTTKVSSTGGNDKIFWRDSAYIDDPSHDVYCDMFIAMENYNKVFYRDTTNIARGIINPLRFFRYELMAHDVTDSTYFPTPEMQMRDTRGDVMLTFRVNESVLDMNQGDNRREMNSLLGQLQAIENNPDAALKSFSIFCTSSPEGTYDYNLNLAKKRMSSALQFITGNLSPTTRRYIDLSSNAEVASWAELVNMMRADGLTEEAAQVEAIVEKHKGSRDSQSASIKRLPFYNSVILAKYLPLMRKVSYQFLTSQYRYLNDDEITQIYAKDPKSLSRFEFFRLYRYIATTPQQKETYLRKGLEVHPKFLIAASDLSAMLTNRGEADPSLLEPYLKPGAKNIPPEAVYNQIAACLATHKYEMADSLASTLPDTEAFHKAKLYTNVFNGKYEESIQELANESPMNEVVLLLAIKANDQAWRKAKQLGNSAEEEYVKAIAANRVDEYMSAISHLQNALRLKPELKEIAKVDGDIIELMEEIEETNNAVQDEQK